MVVASRERDALSRNRWSAAARGRKRRASDRRSWRVDPALSRCDSCVGSRHTPWRAGPLDEAARSSDRRPRDFGLASGARCACTACAGSIPDFRCSASIHLASIARMKRAERALNTLAHAFGAQSSAASPPLVPSLFSSRVAWQAYRAPDQPATGADFDAFWVAATPFHPFSPPGASGTEAIASSTATSGWYPRKRRRLDAVIGRLGIAEARDAPLSGRGPSYRRAVRSLTVPAGSSALADAHRPQSSSADGASLAHRMELTCQALSPRACLLARRIRPRPQVR